jgi:hypothetical protein
MAENVNSDNRKSKDIICYNCLRSIDISDLGEGTFFKCQRCYTTLVVADYFRTIRAKLLESRNRWGVIGLILGLSPMLLIMGMVTTRPVLFVFLFSLLNIIIIANLYYFKRVANDILLGIIFSELGIYANLTSIVLNYFSAEPFNKNVPDLSMQIYFFLISGSLLIFWGIRRRKKFVLR